MINGFLFRFLQCRWLFGTTAILLQFLSLQYISVADSLVITVITPVFVTLVAHKVLGEKCGFIPILCAIVTVLGVGVMTRPSIFTGQKEFFDGEALIGISFALASMVCTGISFVLVRYLRTIHFSVMMTFFGVWGTMECGLLSVWYGDGVIFPEEMKDSVLALLLAVLSFISQGSLVLGLKFEQASMVAVFRTLDVLFGFVWQGLLLGVVPDVYSVVGGITVTVGVLVLGFRKWLIQLPEGHKARNLFYLILK
ncbi:solute carrier family 35 member G1 isoform X1 [Folsomia candida]|uniref:solute carrier family 35 member G1 isoform X1 n=1 Tax=Folsomia candida TaxID=158441 RepID=UPI00160549F0|nr:solute carrier family 35 member G1 isoform X1 [Folsomia candida]